MWLYSLLRVFSHDFVTVILLTILCTGPEEINDVLVFANHLHHFHLWHQVRQVFLRGVIYKQKMWKVSPVSPSAALSDSTLFSGCFWWSVADRQCGLKLQHWGKLLTQITEVSFQCQREGAGGIKNVQSGLIICCTGSFFMGLIEAVDLSKQPERHCLHSSAQLPYLHSF